MGKSSPTKLQSKHIPYGMVIDAVRGLSTIPKIRVDWRGDVVVSHSAYVSLSDIQNLWPTVPPKIIQAKLRRLIEHYRVLEGCACGCSTGITLSPFPLYEVVGVYGPGGKYHDKLRPVKFGKPMVQSDHDVLDLAKELRERFE